MSRVTAAANGNPNNLEDDTLYQGVLVSAEFTKSKKEGYSDQVLCKWELRQGAVQWDYVPIAVGQRKDGTVAKLRQMLNALAEKDKEAELWFDPDTLEWGYDLDADDSTPAYAKLRPGLVVQFKGEIIDGRYKITGYRSPAKPKK